MSGFADVYQRLCERYPDEQDRGRAFEPLVKRVLSTDPLYRERFAEVWRWHEWPGRDGGDIGIDLVAKRHDGGLVAIQCKCQDRIEKSTINSFLADSQRRLLGEPYVERYIFTTATRWSDNAERALSRIKPAMRARPMRRRAGIPEIPSAAQMCGLRLRSRLQRRSNRCGQSYLRDVRRKPC